MTTSNNTAATTNMAETIEKYNVKKFINDVEEKCQKLGISPLSGWHMVKNSPNDQWMKVVAEEQIRLWARRRIEEIIRAVK